MSTSLSDPKIAACVRAAPTLVIGIGSPHGDDKAGWEVIDRFVPNASENLILRKAAVPHDILDWFDVDFPTHIIDASCDKSPGLRRYSVTLDDNCQLRFSITRPNGKVEEGLATQALRSSSTHQIDLLSTFELAALLKRLPRRLTLWTISIVSSQKCDDVATQTRMRIDECVTTISKELIHA